MLKFFQSGLAGVFCALFCLPIPAGALSTAASSAVLMEADSTRVLYAQDAQEKRPIASITKLVTALVAAERIADLDAEVLTPQEAVGVEGSSIYLRSGEQITSRQLLYGLLLQSGNDAAVALAVSCAGDLETFVDWMNQKAQALGMTNTHFANPSGLDDPAHYSTAYDMALAARAALAQPVLAEICATRYYAFGARSLTNHNKLLWRYPDCVGLKTGYTQAAGRTLVSAATRAGTTLIAVTLADPQDWSDHSALLDYGFQMCHNHLLCRQGKAVGWAPVWGSLVRAVPVETGEDVRWALKEGEEVTAQRTLSQDLQAPVNRGDRVGRLTFYLDGAEIGGTDLLAAADAPRDQIH